MYLNVLEEYVLTILKSPPTKLLLLDKDESFQEYSNFADCNDLLYPLQLL